MCCYPGTCCCCAPPLPSPYPIIYTQAITADTQKYLNQNSTPQTKPPPVDDETWHHGYTCCNCQECCDFRNCCDCSGCCYTYNVGRNSTPFFNSPYGPLYEYYQNGCCRSCFAAQFSGASCIGSLLPCWCNRLYVVDESNMTELQMLRNRPGGQITQRYPIQIPTGNVYQPEIFTVNTGAMIRRPYVQNITPALVPQVIPQTIQPFVPIRPILQQNVIPYINSGGSVSTQRLRLI